MSREIEEGNRLIAEFMGGILYKNPSNDHSFKKVPEHLIINTPFLVLEDLKYHTSWNWLMPIVEKIAIFEYERWEDEDGKEKITVIDTAYPRTFGMLSSTGKFMVRFNRCSVFTADTLIEATWVAVVDFIKFYNQKQINQ